jgi:hypothetical protein
MITPLNWRPELVGIAASLSIQQANGLSMAGPFSNEASKCQIVALHPTKDLPSGCVKIAIENGHRNSGFSH